MKNDPVTSVVTALEARGCRPKKAGGGWSARCPAHDGKGKTSLSISLGDDGRALVHCFAGCSSGAVVNALGLNLHDLFSRDSDARQSWGAQRAQSKKPSPSKPTRRAATAAEALPRKHGTPAKIWEYQQADGQPVGAVARWNLPGGGKAILPASVTPEGAWVLKAMPEPRPLYNLPAVISSDGAVVVVEGEKCADVLVSLGLTATTSAGGAKAVNKADWSALANRPVVIFPDHDEAGDGYAADVARLAAEVGAHSVSIVRLVDHWSACPAGGDVADWIETFGDSAEPADIRARLEAMIAQAKSEPLVSCDEDVEAVWVPFPTAALPEPVRSFVTEAAEAVGVDESMVALPLLAMLAGAVGNARRLRIKPQWSVPAVLWTAIVSDSGSGKSPSLRLATQFTDEAQTKAFLRFEQEKAECERALQEYEVAMKRAASKGGRIPQKPLKPTAKRFVANDTTVEALVPILCENPRGIALAVDELAGWFTSHDAYRSAGRGGVDRPKWLSTYDAGPVTVDRKTSGTVHCPAAAVSITGGVQPSILKSVFTPDNLSSGLVSRFMCAWPPRRPMRWTEGSISASVMQQMSSLFAMLLDRLASSALREDGPQFLSLRPEAKEDFRKFAEDVYSQQAAASGAEAAMLSKLTATAARLALVIHMARWATPGSSLGDVVDVDSIRSGITIAQWAGREQRRIYSLLLPDKGVDEVADDAARLGQWLAGRGGFASDRDIRHGLSRFRDGNRASERADAAAARLVAEGRAVRATMPTGGRPARGLRLEGTFGAFGSGAAGDSETAA